MILILLSGKYQVRISNQSCVAEALLARKGFNFLVQGCVRVSVLFLSAYVPAIGCTFRFWAPSFFQITLSRFHDIIPRVHYANNEKNLAK